MNYEICNKKILGSSNHVYFNRKSFIVIGSGKCVIEGQHFWNIYRESHSKFLLVHTQSNKHVFDPEIAILLGTFYVSF